MTTRRPPTLAIPTPTGQGPAHSALPSAMLAPPRGGNAFEAAVERLARTIRAGVVAPGERLPPERELAAALAVGRTTLREALEALRTAGYVQTRRGRGGGTFVCYDVASAPPPSAAGLAAATPADVADAIAFRRVVEPGAVALAASRRLDDAQTAALRLAFDAVTHAEDEPTHRGADSRLHLALAELSGSPSVVAAVVEAQLRVGELLAAIPVLRRNISHSDRQHAAIVTAVLEGDAVAARVATEEHCDATSALLRGFLT